MKIWNFIYSRNSRRYQIRLLNKNNAMVSCSAHGSIHHIEFFALVYIPSSDSLHTGFHHTAEGDVLMDIVDPVRL